MALTVRVQGATAPALGFGTWRLAGEACEAAVADAIAVGYRHIDTARMYQNEAEVGRAMRASGVARESIFLVSKIWPDDFPADRARKAAEASLAALGVDYLDLMLMHWPPRTTPLEETLAALAELQEAGKILHLGVSNFGPKLMTEAVKHTHILTNQIEYHPLKNQSETVAWCQGRDIMITAYSPIARGAALRDETIRRIAVRQDKTPAQVCLRWLVQQDKVAVIPKAATPEHRRSNFAISDFQLSEEEMAEISAIAQKRGS